MFISDTGNSDEQKPGSLRIKKGKMSAVSNCDITGYPSTGHINCQNKCVKELIEKGFNLHTIDTHGQTTLIIALTVGHPHPAIYGRVKCLNKLIMAEADSCI